MLLPTKTLSPARSLLGLGAVVLKLLNEPKPVSRIWEEFKKIHNAAPNSPTVTFAWFVLALDVLYMLDLIRYEHNRLAKTPHDSPPVQQPPSV
jgi:hypothetical protein